MFENKKRELERELKACKIDKGYLLNKIDILEEENKNFEESNNTIIEALIQMTFDNLKLKEEIINLKKSLEEEEIFSSVLSVGNDELNKENEKLTTQVNINNNYIKKLEKEILKQKQIIKIKINIYLFYMTMLLYTQL